MCIASRYSVFFILLICNITSFSQTQDSLTKKEFLESQVDEIVVTGQLSKVSINNTAQKITIIGPEILESNVFQTLSDVIITQSSFQPSRDNILGDGVSIQGVSGQNVKILIDEIPVIGRLDGNIDLSQISLSNVERIEIIEGPSSVSYGTDALAGTINLITKKNYNKLINLSLNNYYEDIGKYNNSLDITYKELNHQFSIQLDRKYFDGWSENDSYSFLPEITLADTNRYKEWKPKESLFGNVQYLFDIGRIKNRVYYSTFFEKITNRGFPRNPYFESAFDDYYYTFRKNVGAEFNYSLNLFNIKTLFAHNRYKRVKNTYYKDLTTLSEILLNDNSSIDTSIYFMNMAKIILNTNSDKQINYQIGIDLKNQYASGKRIYDSEQEQNNIALFGNIEYKFRKFLFRNGIRLISNSLYSAPIISSTNLLYKFRDFQYRISYSNGFRAPTLKELFFEFNDINHNIVGNSDLLAETSNNLQTSIIYNNKYTNFNVKYSVDGFYNHITNKIDLLQSIDNIGQYTYYNIDSSSTHGLNYNMEISTNKLRIGTKISKIGIKNNEFNIAYNYQLSYSNIFSYSLTESINLNLYHRYFGVKRQLYINQNNIIDEYNVDSYRLLDFSIQTTILDNKIICSFGAKNIFDIMQINSININQIHSSNSNSTQGGYGRTIFASINFKL